MHVCITGASRGLGRALSLQWTGGGGAVWGVARDAGGLAETGMLCTPPGSFRSSVVDVADRASVHRWKDEVQAGGFDPDCVVLNASILQEDMAEGLDAQAAARVLAVNLQGALWCVEAFLPGFLARRRGTFVVISSTSALRPSRRSASYTASKAGVLMAFRSLRERYRGTGVRFKTVLLGPIQTEMWEGKKIPLLIPPPERAARAIARFLPSPRQTLYYPSFTTALLRLSSWLPDPVFSAASKLLLH